MLQGSYRTREETIFFADIGKSTLTKTEQDVFSAIMTSAEIARRAGVSKTAVSRYLNNGYVSSE
uniref:LacI family DNA-binding transcriptional regulator n=1 Tax=Ruminococcus bicirculans (ex Wegman et al. 2014) TaxID=1160721 RepID=UPI003FD73716